MSQVQGKTPVNSRSIAGGWTGRPGYSMSKMSLTGKPQRAPARQSKLMELGLARLQNWEVKNSEADPTRVKERTVISQAK